MSTTTLVLSFGLSSNPLTQIFRTDWAGGMLRDHNLPLVAIRDVEEHLHRRRAWNRGLGPAALRAYEDVLARRARLLVSKLEERARDGEEVDLGRWFGSFGYDFMSDMACVPPESSASASREHSGGADALLLLRSSCRFGGGSELLRDGDKDNVWAVLEKGMA